MSLLITSSQSTDKTTSLGIEKPWQYTNHLKNPLVIEPNSQVAVESVKINRAPNIDYENGAVTNFWFGTKLSDDLSLEDSIHHFIPQENTIRKSLPIQDFCAEFQSMMASAYSLHPSIQSSAGTSTSFVTPGYDSGVLSNFVYQIATPQTLATSVIPADGTEHTLKTTLVGDADYESGSAVASTGPVSMTFKLEGSTNGPLSNFNGDAKFGCSQTGATDWTVGLARAVDVNDFQNSYLNYGFEPTMGLGYESETFYEYAVQCQGGLVKVYHCIPDVGGGNDLVMKEIVYYEKNNGSFIINNVLNSSFATGAPIAGSAITQIQFSLANETLTISDQTGKVIVTSAVSAGISASHKQQAPKPNGQNGWKLYPQISLWDDGDKLSLDEWDGRTSFYMKDNFYGNDWPTHCTRDITYSNGVKHEKWTGAKYWPEELDQRDVFRQYEAPDATPDEPTYGGTIHSYKGLSTDVMEDYETILIGGPSTRYMSARIQNWQPNTADRLGFSPMSVFPDDSTGIDVNFGTSFTSPSKPSTSSDSSVFIRTPRLDLVTHNAGTGNPSKILYALPRFDNSGTDSGALYFQAHDRLYVDLNNTDEVRITDFTTELVKKNETFARDLTGSTEVLYHFRPKPHKL
jgi:hypothetical protein